MSFPLTAAKLQGYDPEQVDALMARVKTQYENPELELVTAAMLAVAKFDLINGGYQISAVDSAIARVADTFEQREIERSIQMRGRGAVATELAANVRQIKSVLDLDPKERFELSRNGYGRKEVNNLLRRISVKRSTLSAPDAFEVRTISLGRSGSGFDREQVDAFLALVVSASHAQKLLS
jgi:DivIVA domain-containing protein